MKEIVKNAVKAQGAETQEVSLTSEPKKAKKSNTNLKESKKNLVTFWHDETHSISALIRFLNSDKGLKFVTPYIDEVNNYYDVAFTVGTIANKKLLKFAVSHELNKVDPVTYEAIEPKSKFSINIFTTLLQRKAQYKDALNPDFIQYVEKRKDDYIINQHLKEVRKNYLQSLIEADEKKKGIK